MKHVTVWRAPLDTVLPEQFQTVLVIQTSDWCQKLWQHSEAGVANHSPPLEASITPTNWNWSGKTVFPG